jgi:hypothetical protein
MIKKEEIAGMKNQCTFEFKDMTNITARRIAVHVMKNILREHEDLEAYVVYIYTIPHIATT